MLLQPVLRVPIAAWLPEAGALDGSEKQEPDGPYSLKYTSHIWFTVMIFLNFWIQGSAKRGDVSLRSI